MQLRSLPADEDAVRRFTEELWLPYHRALEASIDAHELAADVESRLDEEVAFRLDRLEASDYCTWVAVDAVAPHRDEGVTLADVEGEFAGFVATSLDACPPVFDRPDRLLVGDIYVRESSRGTGLARELIDRSATQAREAGCQELTLEVAADNERALAFYEKLGFETRRHQLTVPVRTLCVKGST